jgi:hypothetical protein
MQEESISFQCSLSIFNNLLETEKRGKISHNSLTSNYRIAMLKP